MSCGTKDLSLPQDIEQQDPPASARSAIPSSPSSSSPPLPFQVSTRLKATPLLTISHVCLRAAASPPLVSSASPSAPSLPASVFSVSLSPLPETPRLALLFNRFHTKKQKAGGGLRSLTCLPTRSQTRVHQNTTRPNNLHPHVPHSSPPQPPARVSYLARFLDLSYLHASLQHHAPHRPFMQPVARCVHQ